MSARDEGLLDTMINAWWGKLLVGVALLLMSIGIHAVFADLDAGKTDSARVWAPLALLYRIAGTWGAVGLVVLLGAGSTGWGIKQLVTGEE